ncbi:hypothetical protein GLAREA_06249 [Glarea lozoyensis ATCC 20868]|uniref:Nucleotidyltransferase n=1 Tax=Glarea lozoyensis (strain ATCC 20868 / MF5171) TaxID=1116229 RepID=S3D452_GLAL2|nr:uncharacterized protein GLAREA_06249 [Glarea lozoyensis ATCC 20868]EPE33237.1 hypothetical protein GLAREA_06249 [Glarea lozoyensis ATCC 20868]
MCTTYTYSELKQLVAKSNNPTNGRLFSAAMYIKDIFNANNIVFGFMGGFSLSLRGSDRRANDIDVAVGATMLELKQVLDLQKFIIIPLGLTSGVLRSFVRVVEFGRLEKLVEVDFLLAGTELSFKPTNFVLTFEGNFGLNIDLTDSVEIINTVLPSESVHQFPVLKLLSAMRSKLLAHFTRNESRDYKDLQWLCAQYGMEIYEFRAELEMVHRQKFIDHCEQQPASSDGSGPNYVRKVKHILGVP